MLQFITALLLSVSAAYGFLDGQWDHDVYTGRQWNDLVTATTGNQQVADKAAFLVLYKPQCEKQIIQGENLVEAQLPPQQYLAFGKYDTVTTPKHVWFPHDEADNLTARYQPKECPEYLYFAPGTNMRRPERYDKKAGVRVLDWVWSKLAARFTIRNERSKAIMVDIRGHKPSGFTVEPGQEIGFTSYVSFILLVNEPFSGEFVYGTVLEPNMGTIVVRENMQVGQAKEQWYKQTQESIRHANNKMRDWRWSLAQIYLESFKQPVLLPTFTASGFRVKQIPKNLYDEVSRYYRDHIRDRTPDLLQLEPAVNQKESNPSMVHLDQAMSDRIAEVIKPMVEEWIGEDTELTRMYGIREYHKGNIVRNHVARVGTQVISVIMVIDKDLDGQADWDFEVMQYDGNRKKFNMNAGQMVFFESATLQHGFPSPFAGRDYAVVFVHFRPFNGWTWDIHPDGHWIMHEGDPKECIDQLITPNTYMKSTKGRVRDEL